MNNYNYIFLKNNKVLFFIFIFISLFIFFVFPQEVFAMEPYPDFITNYYGGAEYIGPDTYKYFHPDPSPNIDTIQSKVSKPYGTTIEDDGYTDKKESDYMNSIPHKHGNIYNYIRRASFYYLGKIHSSEYNGYKDFKKSWDPNSSIRKEILKDIKSELK